MSHSYRLKRLFALLALFSPAQSFLVTTPRHVVTSFRLGAPFPMRGAVRWSSKSDDEESSEDGSDARDPGLSTMVDELIKQAQLDAREGVDMNEEDALAQSKRMVASMFDEGAIELSKTLEEVKKENEARKELLDAESDARAKAETDDLMSKIEGLTADFEASVGGLAKAKRSSSSFAPTGDPVVDAALAAAESRAMKRGGSAASRPRSTTCVIVEPPWLQQAGRGGPIATALEARLEAAGWIVKRLSAGLDSLAAVVQAAGGAEPPPAGGGNTIQPAVDMDGAAAACREGAVLVICPDEDPKASGDTGGESSGGGGFFGKALGALAGGAGSIPKPPLAAVDGKAIQKLIGGYLGGSPSHVVLLSAAGVDRADKFPYSVANVGGALDKRRSAEQAIALLSLQYGFDYSIMRIGNVVGSSKTDFGGSGGGGSGGGDAAAVELRAGDALDGPVAVDVAAGALAQSITAQPAARNATFCVAGGGCGIVDDPLFQGGKDAQASWDDLFLRIDGPELFRADVSRGGARSVKAATVWVQNWAEGWAQPKGTGLTTKVRVKETTPKEKTSPAGGGTGDKAVPFYAVGLYFDPNSGLGGGYVSAKDEKALEAERDGKGKAAGGQQQKRPARSRIGLEGGVEIIVDRASPDEPDRPRIRARRFAYGDGITVKEMSEETILRRLKSDVERWAK